MQGEKGFRLTLLVPVALNVPVSEDISRLVLFDTRHFNLLETPLRQIHIASPKIASKIRVSKSECCSQSTDLGVIARGSVTDDFNDPVILGISNRRIAITGNFPVSLSD